MAKPTQPTDPANQPDYKSLATEERGQIQMLHEWVQLAPLAMALIRYPEGTILATNLLMAELLEWTPELMCGRTTRELGILVNLEQREQIIQSVSAHQEPIAFDTQLSSQSGQLIDVQGWVRYTRLQDQEYLLLSLADKTDIKRTEEELRISQEKFSLAFQMSPDAVVITDRRTGCLIEVNRSFERLFGWKADEAIGRSAFDLGLWANLNDRARLIEGINTNTAFQIEAMAQARDGSLTLTQVYGAEFTLNDAPTLVLTIRDISQQRQQEQVTRDSEERLSMALESAHQGFWDWQIDSGHYYGSARTASLHGLGETPLDDSIDNVFQNMPADTQRTVYRSYKLVLEAPKQPVTFTYKVLLPSGNFRHLEAIAHLYRDAQNQPVRMVGILLDISEKVLHEQQIKASEEKFTALFQASMEPCCVVEKHSGELMDINQSFSETFGWTPQEIIGQPPSTLELWAESEHAREIIRLLREQNLIRNYPIRLRHKQGHILQCLCSMRQLQVGNESVITVSILDITSQLKANEALRSSQDKFAKAFHNSPDAISIVDLESTCYMEINEGFTRVSGYTSGDVVGKSFHDVGIWSTPDQLAKLNEIFVRDGRIRNQEVFGHHKNGASLTLSVSVVPFELNGSTCILTTSRDISDLKSAEARIEHMAYHDPLTNLPNRTLLTDRLNQQIPLLKRHNMRGALLFMDLDHFKTINDSLGHAAGDTVLKRVASRLEKAVRAEDTVARLGGDEFVILLNAIEGNQVKAQQDAMELAETLRVLLAEPMLFDGHQLHISPSIGIALIPDHGDNPVDLLKHADIALYSAKDAGRNTSKIFQSAMLDQVNERLRMETDLRLALERNEFELHYQPQVDARTGRIIGAEALLRWEHPTLGQQFPDQFIHILEESRQIVSVGHWILEEACRVCATLLKKRLVTAEQFSLSVNISAEQFAQPDFTESVFKILEKSRIPARMLKLEITESIVIKDMESTIAKMHLLQQGGVNFAMDDFGTGYSSLTYLKRLPVDVLKIDQSFIHDATHTSSDGDIIRAIIAMAQSLNLSLIAEGVEQQAQLDFLTQAGCHIYQGYLFSKPVAFAEFRQLLQQ